jgi:2-methylcitrate dehydratase
MDKTTKAIVDFTLAQNYADLSKRTIHEAVRHHLDGVGYTPGGFSSKPCTALRNFVARAPMPAGCSTYGVSARVVPEYAVMASGSTNRHLDFNDTGVFPGSGSHPNDMTPALFAAVEIMQGGGKDFILAMHIGYEVLAALAFAYDFRVNGWDQGTQIGVATAAAVGRIFGLSREAIGNAISLTLMPGSALRVVRTGDLSNWKGCATAHAAMNAFFATQLAREGITGPSDIFEGTDGFWKQISRGSFSLEGTGARHFGLTALERTFFKFFPAEYNSQGVVAAFLQLRKQFKLEDLVSIDIATYWMAWHEIGGGQGDATDKWDPQTREGADHSLPYLVAVALVDGKVTLDSFVPQRVKDPALRPVMKKISVTCSDELEERFQKTTETGARIVIKLKDGSEVVHESWHPKGSWQNPMDDDELNQKFDSLIQRVLPERGRSQLRDMLWGLEELASMDALAENYRSWQNQ